MPEIHRGCLYVTGTELRFCCIRGRQVQRIELAAFEFRGWAVLVMLHFPSHLSVEL